MHALNLRGIGRLERESIINLVDIRIRIGDDIGKALVRRDRIQYRGGRSEEHDLPGRDVARDIEAAAIGAKLKREIVILRPGILNAESIDGEICGIRDAVKRLARKVNVAAIGLLKHRVHDVWRCILMRRLAAGGKHCRRRYHTY